MTVLEQLIENIQEVLRNRGIAPPSIGPDTKLDDGLTLDSLDYAELIVRMQSTLGVDPFATGQSLEIETIGDLAAIYERAKATAA